MYDPSRSLTRFIRYGFFAVITLVMLGLIPFVHPRPASAEWGSSPVNRPARMYQAECYYPDYITTAEELDDCIQWANDNGGADLTLGADIYLGTELTPITSTITIDGAGNFVDGSYTSMRLFYVESSGNLTLNAIVLQNGSAEYGGGIYNNHGALTVNDSTFSYNSAEFGGGIFNTGTLTVTGSTFEHNSAGDSGGGIYNDATITATVTSSTFEHNSAGNYGGGIANPYTVTVTEGMFFYNSATYGGGIYNAGAATVTWSTFSDNSATSYGGGIYIRSDSTVTVTDSTFEGNWATHHGGGIYTAGWAAVTSSTFSGNSAEFGGGIYNLDTLTVTASTFSSNSATSYGGGIFNRVILTVTSSTFEGNSAAIYGGGIENYGGPLTVTGSTFSDNSANSGGGIYNASSTLTVTASTFSGNSAAGSGGGIYNNNSVSVYLAGTLLDTGASGGNCYNDGGSITDNGYDLSDDGSCGFGGPGSMNNATLNLGPLAYNDGGSTQTHKPGAGSAAIGRIPYGTTVDNEWVTLACNNSTTDQNGISRPRVTGGACTSGSVEVAAAPEIGVEGPGPTAIADGGTYNMGTTTVGTPISQTITVRNTGTAVLNLLTNPPAASAGFTASTFGSTTVAAGGSTTFTLTCTAAAPGSPVSGTVSFNNNDSDENPFNFTVTCTVNAAPAPEIGVEGPGPTAIADGGTYNMGTTTVGTPLSQTITVRNTGTAALNLLTNPPTASAGFTASTFGSTTVAPGGSTTFTLTCTAAAPGSPVSGTVSFNNNDSDENPFNFTVTCTVNAAPAPEIAVEGPGPTAIADGGTYHMGTTTVGTPLSRTITVRNTGTAALNLLTNPPTASAGFTAGTFGSTTVAAGSSTPFTLTCTAAAPGAPVSGTVSFNNNDSDENPFNFTVTCTVNAASAPEIGVEGPGPTAIPDGGTYNMGTTTVGTPLSRTITVRNTGTAALNLLTNPPAVSAGFTASTFGSTTVAAGGSTTFTLTCTAAAPGSPVSGTVSFNNNDSDENPFNFTVTCTVNAAPAPEIAVEGPGPTAIADGGTYNMGTTTVGTPLSRTITVRNTGNAALNLLTNPPTASAGFTASTFGSTTVAAGGSTTFTLTCTAAAPGAPVSGTVSFNNNDSDENPFNFTVTCTVNAAAAPEIAVEGPGPTAIADGGTYDIGTTTVGTPLSQTITVRNTGTAALNLLTNPPTASAGFTASTFGSTTVAAGGSTTFTLTCTAAAPGSPVSGTVSFNNNDSDENPFNFTVTCTVNAAPAPEIAVEGPGPTAIADGGTYDIGTTTVGTPLTRTITVRNTGTGPLNLLTNPPTASAGFTASTFGSTTVAAGGSTTFTLTCTAAAPGSPVTGTVSFNNNDSDENPFNFTVTCTVNAAPAPEIAVEGPGPTNIADGGSYNMGTTTVGTPISQTITVRNTGTAVLNLLTNPPTVSAGFTASTFGSTTVAAGGSTPFTLTCTAAAPGSPVSGTVSFNNNDSDENPFNFTVTCTVNAAPAPEIGVEGPGPTAIADGGTYNMGTTTVGTPLSRTITVRNTGTAVLNLLTNPPTVSAGFTAGTFGSTTVAAGGSTTFTLTCTATAPGAPVTGTVSFNNNDSDENPFNFTVTCTVNTPAGAPVLVSPPDGTLTNNNRPTFTWNPTPTGTSYQIQIATTSDFLSPVQDVTQTGLSYTATTLADATTYYWHVRAFSGGVPGPWSETRSVSIDIARLSAPLLRSPKDGTNIPDTTPKLAWKSVKGAVAYHLQLSSLPDFDSAGLLVNQDTLTVASYTLPDGSALLYDTYYWRARARDAAGRWSDWSVVRGFTVTFLKTPRNGDFTTDTTPTLRWITVKGAVGYYLQVARDETFTDLVIDNNTQTGTACTPTLDYMRYYWRMQVNTGSGYVDDWTPVWTFTITPTPPGKPTLTDPLDKASLTDATPTFTWDPVVPEGVLYQIQIDDQSSFKSPLQDVTISDTSTTADTLPAGGKYYWRVRALNSVGVAGKWSRTWSFTLAGPADVLTLVTPTDRQIVCENDVPLTWVEITGITAYQVQVSTSTKFTTPVVDTIIIGQTTTVTNLTDGTYFWRVRPVNNQGVGGTWTQPWRFGVDTIGPLPPVLKAPKDFTATLDTTPTFSWSKVKDGTRYHLRVSDDPGLSGTVVNEENLTQTRFVLPPEEPLEYGRYYWQVAAMDTCHWGGWSLPSTFTVTIHKAPKDGSTTTDATPTFTWAKAAGVNDYLFQIADNPDFVGAANQPLTTTKYAPAVPLEHGLYYWHVSIDGGTTWMPAWTVTITPGLPGKPKLITPANKTLTNDSTPTLGWGAASDGATYQIQIDDDKKFYTPDQNATVGELTYTATELGEGTWYWRVQALNSVGAPGKWSTTWSLTVDITPPTIPVPVAPAGDTRVTNPKLVLEWSASEGAVRYEVQLDTNPAFPLPPIDAGKKTTYRPPTPLAQATYYWRVRAVDKAGNVSLWSDVWTFHLVAGNTIVTTPTGEPILIPAQEPVVEPPPSTPDDEPVTPEPPVLVPLPPDEPPDPVAPPDQPDQPPARE